MGGGPTRGRSVDEFAVADVDGQHGFLAVTNQRFIFLARTRTSLASQQKNSLNQLASVEPLGRRGKAGLIVGWKQAAPIMIEGHGRAQLGQLRASLLARATKPDGLQELAGAERGLEFAADEVAMGCCQWPSLRIDCREASVSRRGDCERAGG